MRKDNNTGIIVITNMKTSQIFICATTDLHTRKINYRNKLRIGKHPTKLLQRDFDRLGADWFRFDVLLHCDKEELRQYQRILKKEFKPYYNTYGSNNHRKVQSLQHVKNSARAKRGMKYERQLINHSRAKAAWKKHKQVLLNVWSMRKLAAHKKEKK